MRQAVQAQLLQMNRHFYATVAEEFDRTRQGLPTGMLALAQLLRAHLPAPAHVLDTGCGNGRFARALAESNVNATYTGVDGDAQLLALAQAQTATLNGVECRFAAADLAQSTWLAQVTAPYDAVVSLAVIHHLPSYALRRRFVQEMASLLAPDGLLALSTWQFLASERLAQRTLAWESVGLTAADVEPGDALLPWNQGAHAVRYVHHLDLAEVEQLMADGGLRVIETFRADGKEGNLNLFVVARPLFPPDLLCGIME
jgi:2-polyprenyl-3-methyl-5-hydroxy-6-metoxy-1,4-benzoquinol methylase